MTVQDGTGGPSPGGRAVKAAVASGRVPLVLMYHSVTPYTADPYLITVSPERFGQQMRWLQRRGLRGVAMRELLAARAAGAGRDLVGLTFDDGYTDFAEHVVPALRGYGFTATVYAIAGRLGQDNSWDVKGPRKPLMTAAQLREVAAAGMEIGSHGMNHVSLEGIGEKGLAEEVGHSRRLLEELSGEPVTGFCYPYGHIDGAAVNRVREAGYGYGCAIWRSPLTGRHALPRTYIGEADSWPRLRAKAVRHWLRWDYRGPGGSQLRLEPEVTT